VAVLDDLDLSGALLRERYLLSGRLGAGGMGIVYAARDTELERPVAIKVIRPEQAQATEARERFRTEARILARLRHPNIVPVYDFGAEILDGATLLYLVMPYIGGGTLHERLRVAPLSYNETAKILEQVAHALDHAHSQRVLHRDLKPLNVLFDEDGAALVADFGLARLIDAGSRAPALTYAGTPPYMAPEQLAMGEGSAATDVYALGMMLHEMLTGGVPPRAQDRDGLFIAKINEALPGRVRAALAQATHHKQAERYQRASDLAAAFAAIKPARHNGHSAAGVAPADEVVVPAADGALEGAVRQARPGAILRLGAGTHRLDRPLRIDKALWLLGAGMEATRVVCDGEGYVLRYEAQGRLVACDLTVAHEGTTLANALEVAQGEADLEACAFTNAIQDEGDEGDPGGNGNGLVVRGDACGVVRHCVAGGNARNGMRIGDQGRVWLEQNDCSGNLCGIAYFDESEGVARTNTCAVNIYHGIMVRDQARPALHRNTCKSNKYCGIAYVGDGVSIVRANLCTDNAHTGIAVGERARPEIAENTCECNEEFGILVDHQAQPILECNICSENKRCGIEYGHDSAGVARGNTCVGNTLTGIEVNHHSQPLLENNVCQKNSGSGISYFGEGGGVARANHCIDNTLSGILVIEQAQPDLEGNICASNTQNGIAYFDESGGVARANTCTANTYSGVWVGERARPELVENTCERNNSSGIAYFGDGGGIARANICASNAQHGILVSEQARPELEGNTCKSNKNYGIAYGGDGVSIARANLCTDNAHTGIIIGERAQPELKGNTCRENKEGGIGYCGEGGGVARANHCIDNTLSGILVVRHPSF